jgi:mevalonate kinase
LEQTYYSNGKLLITGEYTVLDGAVALALPTKFGQYLTIKESNGTTISWKSLDADGTVWFEDEITFDEIRNNTGQEMRSERSTLINILHVASLANPDVFNSSEGFTIETKVTFPRKWGLGTSSTLINNIAQWFGINAFELLNKSFGGSGYDIACAQHHTPILYKLKNKLPFVKEAPFNPTFDDKLYFVYLNQKQNSRSAIAAYRENRTDIHQTIHAVNTLTETIVSTQDFFVFTEALQTHETIISGILGLKTVKEALFPDFTGALKSLGAWGGDFILAAAPNDPTDYFTGKGYHTILKYKDMIL